MVFLCLCKPCSGQTLDDIIMQRRGFFLTGVGTRRGFELSHVEMRATRVAELTSAFASLVKMGLEPMELWAMNKSPFPLTDIME